MIFVTRPYCSQCNRYFSGRGRDPGICECGKPCQFRCVEKNGPNDIQVKSDFCNITGLMEEHPRYSMSLGVLDEDLPEAKRISPETEWKRFGNSWRPLIRNRMDKLRLLRQNKMTEYS